MASKDSLGSFDTVAADALITEFRRRMLMFKVKREQAIFSYLLDSVQRNAVFEAQNHHRR
jgi:hypothetical protein